MVIDEVWFDLKDGRKALIRSPREVDVEGMLDHLRVSAGETEFIIRCPEECDRYTYENEKKLFEQLNASEDNAMLVCLVDGKVAGNSQIMFNSKRKTRHRASVAIALNREFWDQGIGTRLFLEMIRLAEKRGDILQMELEVVEGNDRARHLYEKMGFRIVGIRPNGIRLKDGSLRNEYFMIRTMEERM